MNKRQKLARRIREFLSKYAGRDATDPTAYSSPDAYQLEHVALMLERGVIVPRIPHSDWGSGGYKPMADKKGHKEHDKILTDIKKIAEN